MSPDLETRSLICEFKKCDQLAISEWFTKDEEGYSYSTVRCENHPVEDEEYHEREL
jgi:hypothetical protein